MACPGSSVGAALGAFFNRPSRRLVLLNDDSAQGWSMKRRELDDPSATGTTIVGGQPTGARRRRRASIPVGIEKVLYLAAVEPEFRRALLSERLDAIEARGLSLRDSERAMLRVAPAAQLEAAIDGLDVSAHNVGRRRFMRQVAAAAVTLAAGEALSGCGEVQGPSTGDAQEHDAEQHYMDAGGARPDVPEDDVPEADVAPLDREAFPEASPAGISPDVPDYDANYPSDSAGIRPDVPEVDVNGGWADAGVLADVPEVDVYGGAADAGILPDVPEGD